MNKGINTILCICGGVAIVDVIIAAFLLGIKKGDNDCLNDLASKNDTLNF